MNALNRIRAVISHYISSEKIPLRGRLFNLITSITSGIIFICSFVSPDSNILLAGLFVITAALIFAANKTGKYQFFALVFTSSCAFILYPFMFIINEGISGGMVSYMVFGAVIINLLISGKTKLVMLFLYLTSIIGLVVLDYWNKQNNLNIFLSFASDAVKYYDVALGLVLCGTGLSFVISFQNWLFERERVKAEDAIQAKSSFLAKIEQNAMHLQAVNRAAAFLLNSDIESFESALSQAMEIMAETVDVDRVYIWKNQTAESKLICTQMYEWSGGAPPQQGLKITIDIPYGENMPGWEETLSSGECVNNIVRNMSPEEQNQLSPQGIISILIAPVIVEGQFWGFVGFDDCHNERVFTKEEVTVLRSVSLLFAHSYLRNETVQTIRETSAKLELALQQANAASKAKGDFLSNMSHEMRTPMNAIIGMTSIGEKADNIEKKNIALNRISNAASHLLGIVNDVLDMAKIEADKMELVPIEYNFEKMLQKVMAVVNFRVDEKRQQLFVNVDSKTPRYIIGDDQRLAQVITNLLSNAVKFTPRGGNIKLNVSFSEGAEEAGATAGAKTASTGTVAAHSCELRIEVIDSGIGISVEHQEKLFRAFEQADSGTSRQYGGTGLGLVISKRIVELMGGKIWAESEPGKGSRFVFTVKAQRGCKSSRSLLSPNVNWKNIRIMAVDDMFEIRSQFLELFTHLGVKCDVAASGTEAFDIIEKYGDYDVYFVDWNMPGLNGIELARRIKSQRKGRHPVVIMITALDWDLIREDAANAGVDKHLLKPLFSSTIIDCVNECLRIETVYADPGSSNGSSRFEGKRLLLVEDIEINREILIALLDGTGIKIDCAENGQAALEMIEPSPYKYDIVLMDIQMPKMDGLEATRRIRAMPALQNTNLPIIAMTANVFIDDIDACHKAGMNDHIGKPLDINKVMEILDKHL